MIAASIAALVAAATGAVDIRHSHSVRIDHHRGAIAAEYRSRVTVTHRQIGAVTPGGVPATLRCAWSAAVTIDRDARHPAGSTFARTIARQGVLTGSRPGWCADARAVIAREVAARGDALRDHLMAAVDEDRAILAAEIDRLPAAGDRG